MSDSRNLGESSESGTPTSAEAIASTPASTPDINNMVSKERVTELIRENRREVAEREFARGRADAEAKYQSQQQSQTQSIGGVQHDEAKIRQLMAEEFTKQSNQFVEKARQEQRQVHADSLAREVMGKVDAAKDRFPDLNDRIDEIAPFSELIPLINATEDAAGVMHDLIENPLKMSQLLMLAQRNPQSAQAQMQRLAQSIKANEAGKQAPRINAPLDSISPSRIGMDSSSNTIEDLKTKDYLRG